MKAWALSYLTFGNNTLSCNLIWRYVLGIISPLSRRYIGIIQIVDRAAPNRLMNTVAVPLIHHDPTDSGSRDLFGRLQLFCLYRLSCNQLRVANGTTVSSQMNHQLTWIGWQQGWEPTSQIRLLILEQIIPKKRTLCWLLPFASMFVFCWDTLRSMEPRSF